jgi:Protein of unknown function (DUF3306)
MAESGDDTAFLARWSRRKAQVREGVAEPPAIAPPQPAAPMPAAAAAPAPPLDTAAAPAAPTLADVAGLTAESDFSRFVAPDVDPGVKNAALKKLFASEPHFNVMDGLDTYIDDYNKFEPIPKAMLRQLVNARALGLIDDELAEQPKPADASPPHEDADLQLQSNAAAGQPGAGPGPAAGATATEPVHDPVPPRGA